MENSFWLSLLSTLLALAVVIALAYGTLRLLRGRLTGPTGGIGRGGADADTLRFVRALPVGTKERVVLIDHRGERWMLGVTAGGISVLARFGATDGPGAAGDGGAAPQAPLWVDPPGVAPRGQGP
jgi:flagellar protein FliO/FliZ